jgi:hypothetical protein
VCTWKPILFLTDFAIITAKRRHVVVPLSPDLASCITPVTINNLDLDDSGKNMHAHGMDF